jgi:hypothetical protein
LITPVIDRRYDIAEPSGRLSFPLLQRLEVLPPLSSTSLEPMDLKDNDELFRLRVGHLPKLSHLSLYHGCNFDIDDDVEHKWHSPLLQSLQFGAIIYSQDILTIMSSTLPLLHTLHVYYVGVAELEMIAKQCPNLQHFFIHEIEYGARDGFGPAIGQMIQLKSLSIALADVPNWVDYLSSQSLLQLKALIHLQRLTIKGCEFKSLKSLPQLIELVQYLSNSNSTPMSSSSSGSNSSNSSDEINGHNNVSMTLSMGNGCLEQMNDMSCHQWLSLNPR